MYQVTYSSEIKQAIRFNVPLKALESALRPGAMNLDILLLGALIVSCIEPPVSFKGSHTTMGALEGYGKLDV